MGRLLTAREVRDRLGLRSEHTIYRWASTGQLRRVVLGTRAIRFREEDVDRFVEGKR